MQQARPLLETFPLFLLFSLSHYVTAHVRLTWTTVCKDVGLCGVVVFGYMAIFVLTWLFALHVVLCARVMECCGWVEWWLRGVWWVLRCVLATHSLGTAKDERVSSQTLNW